MDPNRRGAWIGLLVILGVALGSRGCGPVEGGAAGGGRTAGEPIGEERATLAGEALGTIGGFSVELFERSLVGGDLRVCADVTGDSDDSDGDEIPDDATLRFDDCFGETGFGIGSVNGTVRLRDLDRNSRDGRFEADLGLRIEALESEPLDWSDATTRVEGRVRGLGREGGGAVLRHFLHIRIDLERNGEKHTVESDTRWRVAYFPDATWRPGESPEPGDYWIHGRWRFEVDGDREEARVDTREALGRRNSGCPFPVDDGELAARLGFDSDDDDRTIHFTWTGCNDGFVRLREDDDWDDDWDDDDHDWDDDDHDWDDDDHDWDDDDHDWDDDDDDHGGRDGRDHDDDDGWGDDDDDDGGPGGGGGGPGDDDDMPSASPVSTPTAAPAEVP